MSELRSITVSGRKIQWILSRKKVKNVNMRIKPDGVVYISASNRVAIKFIEEFIREKSDFIFSALDKFAVSETVPKLPQAGENYNNGDTFRYFGTDYTLSIIISPIEDVKISGKLILATVKSSERTGFVLKKFYAEKTLEIFTELNKQTYEMFRAKGYRVPLAELQMRSMTSRWGSCHITKGKIVMNSRLALYPENCAAYVFIHEYAHFIVPNHSRDFYGVVSDLMPDYKICVNILKKWDC